MQQKVEFKKEMTLSLTTKEAEWLKAVMQNPLKNQSPMQETTEECEMRHAFWDALDNMLNK